MRGGEKGRAGVNKGSTQCNHERGKRNVSKSDAMFCPSTVSHNNVLHHANTQQQQSHNVHPLPFDSTCKSHANPVLPCRRPTQRHMNWTELQMPCLMLLPGSRPASQSTQGSTESAGQASGCARRTCTPSTGENTLTHSCRTERRFSGWSRTATPASWLRLGKCFGVFVVTSKTRSQSRHSHLTVTSQSRHSHVTVTSWRNLNEKQISNL